MEYTDAFYTQADVALIFNVSKKTVWNWVNRRRKTGTLKPCKRVRKAAKLKEEPLRQYIKGSFRTEISENF
jgi:transposase